MRKVSSGFRADVEKLVSQIPYGEVSTYGDIAAMAGRPHAARMVGGIAHYGDPALPWHRVVNRFGGLASGYPGGRENHARHLLKEGISSTNHRVDNFEDLRWKISISL